MHIAVVIPAYNESERIGKVLQDLSEHLVDFSGHELRIIVVDDGSRDDTNLVAAVEGKHFSNFNVLHHRTNLGKGAAAKTGCDAAYKLGADIIVLMDADGQHQGKDVIRMVKPLLDRQDGLVIGTRAQRKYMPVAMRLGNFTLTFLSKLLFSIGVRDTQSGFRAFRRDTYPRLRWIAANYAMEIEMLILGAANSVPMFEVGIATIYNDNYKGTTPLDGIRILKTMVKWKALGSYGLRKVNSISAEGSKL